MSASLEQPEAILFVIFGITGDLTWRKLIPALFSLYLDNCLPEKFCVVGLGRTDDDETFRQRLSKGIRQPSFRQSFTDEDWEQFARSILYEKVDFTEHAEYQKLGNILQKIEQDWCMLAERIFYMATPSSMFGPIATLLGQAGLASDREHARLVVEKPIGHDLDSALTLNQTLLQYFNESQIYRIDHFLGKETVQNLMAFRFANPIFEPIWNRHYIDHVTITVAEDIGVEHRAKYFEQAGSLRDMVQNHLLQLLCLVGMEPPISFEVDEIHNKKVDVLYAVRAIASEEVYQHAVRGQYGAGWVKGKYVRAYREEPGVDPHSETETFVALKLFVDNWRWQDVPFYLRTGKSLPEKVSEISIRFRAVPHQMFPTSAILGHQPVRLVICIHPNEGIVLKFHAKQPGQDIRLLPVDMHFSYTESFQKSSPEAYETLLWDIMIRDATLFMRADQVERAWQILMPILDFWKNNPTEDFPNYPAGSWGPEASEGLTSAEGRSWLFPTVLEGNKVRSCSNVKGDNHETVNSGGQTAS